MPNALFDDSRAFQGDLFAPQITLEFIKKLGAKKSEENLDFLIKLFYENDEIELKREITSSSGEVKIS